MIGWLMRWWRARQRAVDVDILWPICKREAAALHPGPDSLGFAHAAFAFHAMNDPAWLALGDGLEAVIEQLT